VCSIAQSEELNHQGIADASAEILRDLAMKRKKMGAAMPRRMMTIGISHAMDFLNSTEDQSEDLKKKVPATKRLKDIDENDALNVSSDCISTANSDEDHAEEVLAMTAAGKKSPPPPVRNLNSVRWAMNPYSEGVDPSNKEEAERATIGDPLRGSKHASASLSLDARYSFTSKLPSKIRKTISKLQPIEHLYVG